MAHSTNPSQELDRSRQVPGTGLGTDPSWRVSAARRAAGVTATQRVCHTSSSILLLIHTKITHSSPPFRFPSPGLCASTSQVTSSTATARGREEAGGKEQGVGTHLPSVVVVNNYSQDKSRHCPVFSLKTRHN